MPNQGTAGVTLGQCQERVIEILGVPDRTFGSRAICWLGSMTPSKPLTEFRIDSKGRVNNVRVAIVID